MDAKSWGRLKPGQVVRTATGKEFKVANVTPRAFKAATVFLFAGDSTPFGTANHDQYELVRASRRFSLRLLNPVSWFKKVSG